VVLEWLFCNETGKAVMGHARLQLEQQEEKLKLETIYNAADSQNKALKETLAGPESWDTAVNICKDIDAGIEELKKHKPYVLKGNSLELARSCSLSVNIKQWFRSQVEAALKGSAAIVKPDDKSIVELMTAFIPAIDASDLQCEEDSCAAVVALIEAHTSGTDFQCLEPAIQGTLVKQANLIGNSCSAGTVWRQGLPIDAKGKLDEIFRAYLSYHEHALEGRIGAVRDIIGPCLLKGVVTEKELGFAKSLIDKLDTVEKAAMTALHNALEAYGVYFGLQAKPDSTAGKVGDLFQKTSLQVQQQKSLGECRAQANRVRECMGSSFDESIYGKAGFDKASIITFLEKVDGICKAKAEVSKAGTIKVVENLTQALDKMVSASPNPDEEEASFLQHMGKKGSTMEKARKELGAAVAKLTKEVKACKSDEEDPAVDIAVTSATEIMADCLFAITYYTFLTLLRSSSLRDPNQPYMRKQFEKVARQVGRMYVAEDTWTEAANVVPGLLSISKEDEVWQG